jgi:hypothetical protein
VAISVQAATIIIDGDTIDVDGVRIRKAEHLAVERPNDRLICKT